MQPGLLVIVCYEISDSNGNPPGQAALDDVFGNGVSFHDFFTRANGWINIPGRDTSLALHASSSSDCNVALVQLFSHTASPVTFTVAPAEGVLGGNNVNLATGATNGYGAASGTSQSVQVDLPSYGSASLAGGYDGGLTV